MRNDVFVKRRLRQLIREELERTDLQALVQEALEGMDFQALVQETLLREQFYITSSTGAAQQRVLH